MLRHPGVSAPSPPATQSLTPAVHHGWLEAAQGERGRGPGSAPGSTAGFGNRVETPIAATGSAIPTLPATILNVGIVLYRVQGGGVGDNSSVRPWAGNHGHTGVPGSQALHNGRQVH